MIKNQIGHGISDLVEQLRSGGMVAAPVPGTPLEVLNSTVPFIAHSDAPEYACGDIIAESQYQAYGEVGQSHHCVEMSSIVKSSARRVRALLDLARNFVNPMVNQVIDDINSEYTRRLDKIAVNLEVVTSKQNPLFKNESIRDLVTSLAKDLGKTKVERPSFFEDFITDKISYLSTAVPGLEAEIAMYLGQRGNANIQQVFENFFAKGSQWEIDVSEDDALIVLLFARKLSFDDDSINFIADGSLGNVRQCLTNIATMAAVKLTTFFTRYDRRDKNKRMIISYPAGDSVLTNRGDKVPPLQIVVEEDLYNDFLTGGGSPDILCGAFLVDQQREVDVLLANQTKYIDRWQRRVNSIRQTNEQAKFDILKRTIINSLNKQLGDDFTQAEGVPFDRRAILDNVAAYLTGLSPLAVNDPYPAVLHIVSCVVFQNKHAQRFLLDMNLISKHNPELDMRHVASQATLNYIINWVRSQIVIGK